MMTPEVHRFTEEIKAEPMDGTRLDRWLSGSIARRILVVPFGGPIPSAKAPRGVDLDGEFFSERTDLYGGYPALLATRRRLVDWHHDNDPAGRMKGAILGQIVMDEKAEDDGVWADFWADAGERRLALVKRLEERGAALYGSSQAAAKAADPETGEITYWPLIRHTITTSPQNTLAVVPPLKAVLEHPDLYEQPASALRALLVGLDELKPELLTNSVWGKRGAKAGRVLSSANERALRDALEAFDMALGRMREVLASQPDYRAEKDTNEP